MANIFSSKKQKGFTPLEIANSHGQNRIHVEKLKQRKSLTGFTLIELLVVIAVIGMLSSIVLVSLGPTRAKARDAKRVAEVKQMGLALEQEAADGGDALAGCVAADAKVNTCTGPGTANFANFADPSAGTGGTACVSGGTAVCQYAISKDDGTAGIPQTDDYQICFYLEQGVGTIGLAAGMNQIADGGNFAAGCQ